MVDRSEDRKVDRKADPMVDRSEDRRVDQKEGRSEALGAMMREEEVDLHLSPQAFPPLAWTPVLLQRVREWRAKKRGSTA